MHSTPLVGMMSFMRATTPSLRRKGFGVGRFGICQDIDVHSIEFQNRYYCIMRNALCGNEYIHSRSKHVQFYKIMC